jgi:hypothetical protein
MNEHGMHEHRFSDHFKLGRSQYELDFVDVPLDTDIALFVDPYAFEVISDPFFDECHDLIVDFFSEIIASIRSGNLSRAENLLNHLHEPNDTRLGLSRGNPNGKAMGRFYTKRLLQALTKSRAVKTGLLRDISDCELFIPNVSNDRVSDMTTNIVRGKLVDYTQQQCRLYAVPMQNIPAGMYWDGNDKRWQSAYAELPVYNGRRILLVPKLGVRHHLEADHYQYYNHFVLNYLQAEHLRANSSLVEVLQNGKRRVTKKRLKEKYPINHKEFLFEFSRDHPEILRKYKASLHKDCPKSELTDAEIEMHQREDRPFDIPSVCARLDKTRPGQSDASSYHDQIIGILTFIFSGSLRSPAKEAPINAGLKKIDICFTNRARSGFFDALNRHHRILCPKVFFECKNYSDDPQNPEFDQIAMRLSDKRGQFGAIVCRTITDRKKVLARCRAIVNDRRDYVIVLDDQDVKQLMFLKEKKDENAIDDYLERKLDDLLM